MSISMLFCCYSHDPLDTYMFATGKDAIFVIETCIIGRSQFSLNTDILLLGLLT